MWPWIAGTAGFALYAWSLSLVLHILLTRRRAHSVLAWSLMITFLPLLGAMAYLLFGADVAARPSLRRRRRTLLRMAPRKRNRFDDSSTEHDLVGTPAIPGVTDPEDRQLLRAVGLIGGRGPTLGNNVEHLISGPEFIKCMVQDIDEAQRFVHVEVYLIRLDEAGRSILAALARAARRGVTVRLLVDAVGAYALRYSDLDPLTKAGVKVAWFFPVAIWRRWSSINLRNHRKIIVVDGQIGYVGGVNLADEFMAGKYGEFESIDTMMRVKGRCINDLSDIFAEDWATASGEDISTDDALFPTQGTPGNTIVQIVESGPDSENRPWHEVLHLALTGATKSIRLATPYFAPDESLIVALRCAARRGVRVDVLLPGRITDAIIMYWCQRWYYPDLLEAGVRVWEMGDVFLHAKYIGIDGRWSLVGSGNVDERSMWLNFEVNALIYDEELAQGADTFYDDLLLRAQRITPEDVKKRSLGERVTESIVRLAAPML